MNSIQPRYSEEPFPLYRFVPGETPHPRRNPKGHSFGQQEPKPAAFEPALWRESKLYAFGIDLFNFGYWWESHEWFEALWRAFGPRTPEGRLFQGLIQLAAAHLKQRMGNPEAATRLSAKSRVTLQPIPLRCMGLDMARVREDIERFSATPNGPAVFLRLDAPEKCSPKSTDRSRYECECTDPGGHEAGWGINQRGGEDLSEAGS